MKYFYFYVVIVYFCLISGIVVCCGKVLDCGLFFIIRDFEVVCDVIVELFIYFFYLKKVKIL